MSYISSSLRSKIIRRAKNRCEYCGLSQVGQVATFHIDHVTPVAAGGQTESDNLALACVSCSLRKGARVMIFDSVSQELVPIYNPRQQAWTDHFAWEDVQIVGKTAIGRATITALDLNRPLIKAIREEESHFDRHPPAG